MAVDKVIVTNLSALRAKYGARYAQVRSALTALAAGDRARGLSSKLIAIDSAAAMRAVGGKAVQSARDQRGAKAAIDAIHSKYSPDYLVIVGAHDVVPHIDLTNPMAATDEPDDDRRVPSDLPYACDAPFGRSPARFIAPTRVLGRIPDEVGASDPALLVGLLATAARHRSRERSLYGKPFALSAKVWRKSTQLSVDTIFGPEQPLLTSPPDGPRWTKAQLAPRVHFINCHGATLSPIYFGEFPRERFFDAHDSSLLRAKVSDGAVVAAECCYGAALYDPADAHGQPAICTTYLREGAYGFFGSTTIAYGPSEGNGQADLICRFFIEAVLGGSSLGRAATEAHHRFVAQFSHLDPSDLKTAVQFILLGDPSVHPVLPVPHALARSRTLARAVRGGTIHQRARAFRRERIARTGHNLSRTVGAAVPTAGAPPPGVQRLMNTLARESGLRSTTQQSYQVVFPAAADASVTPVVRQTRRQRRVHVLKGVTGGAQALGLPRLSALIATLEGGRVVHLRRVHSR
jgi:hypothetical protein